MTDRVQTGAIAAFQGSRDRAPRLLVGRAAHLIGVAALTTGLILPGGALAQEAGAAAAAAPGADAAAGPLAYIEVGSFLRYENEDPGDGGAGPRDAPWRGPIS
jgi:hypothetical protein